jgi:hypothetical protein
MDFAQRLENARKQIADIMAYYSHGPSSYASVWDQFWVPCPFPVAVHSQRVVSIGFCSTFPQILCLACIVLWSESIESKRLTVKWV